jgi:hypothetical protein
MVGFTAPGQLPPALAVQVLSAPPEPGPGSGPLPPLGRYDVILDGQGYMIDPETYRRRPAQRFAPKTRIGDESTGDFVNGSVWSQTNWTEGFGFLEWGKAHPNRFADGAGTDISYGDVRPGRNLVQSYGSIEVTAFAQFHGNLYAIASDSALLYYTTDGLNWYPLFNAATVVGSTTTRLASIWAGFGQLLVGSGNNGQIFSYDGATVLTLQAAIPYATAITAGLAQTYNPPYGGTSPYGVSLLAASDVSPDTPSTTKSQPGTSTLIQYYSAPTTLVSWAPVTAVPWQRIDALALYANSSAGASSPASRHASRAFP